MDASEELIIAVESLQNLLIAQATGNEANHEQYGRLRRQLMCDPRVDDKLPRFVKTCGDLSQFWPFIQTKYSTYRERREFLWGEFRPILDALEGHSASPADDSISENLELFDENYIRQIWRKALDRRSDDPEAAITSARTLLESVCKSILDKSGVEYEDDADLPKLYRLTSEHLKLAPSQHTERIFKQIFGGCQAVVEGLGAIRNRLGDAHGKGTFGVAPEPRHAELAVNLAGAMATFLIATSEAQS